MERTITVLTDVKDVAELLGGARVDQANVIPQGGASELRLELTRAMLECSPQKRGLFQRPKVPWTKSRLTLKQITGMEVRHVTDQPPEEMPVVSVEAAVGGYQVTVKTPEGLQMVMTALQLDGTFADVGAPIQSP